MNEPMKTQLVSAIHLQEVELDESPPTSPQHDSKTNNGQSVCVISLRFYLRIMLRIGFSFILNITRRGSHHNKF